MSEDLLYGVNEWLIAFLLLGFSLLAAEFGFRKGSKIRLTLNEAAITQVGTICGAIIGLLALLLAFTFAMALSRNDLRRELMVEEANAIGAVYLRADLLPEPERSEIRELARQYVAVRLEFYKGEVDNNLLEQINVRTLELQDKFWALVRPTLQKDDRQVTTGLFIESLNDLIDLHPKRLTAMENHVPEGIFVLLFIVALMTSLAVGYGSGMGKHRHAVPTVMLCVIVVLVIAVITDLDRPRRGFFRINQESMLRVRDEMSRDAF